MRNRKMQFEGHHEGEAAQGSLVPLFSPECCRERIYYRLVSMKRNEGLKDKVPCIPFLDMLVTFHVLIQSNGEQICSLRITNEIAEKWGMDTRALYSLARENTSQLFPKRICRLRDMVEELCRVEDSRMEERISSQPDGRHQAECIKEMWGIDVKSQLQELSAAIQEKWYMEPYVLTNSVGINGAAVVLYSGIMRLISDGFGGDCYVLPSSVHELLVLPAEEGLEVEEKLRCMVREVNDTYVSNEDFLSDKIYRYDRKRDCMKICPAEEYA